MNFWSDNIDALWDMAKAYKRGSLTIFIGAGISHGCGLPLWPDLVRALHIEVASNSFPANGVYGTYQNPKSWGGLIIARSSIEFNYLTKLPAPIQSRFCKNQLGSQYGTVLRKVLYDRPYQISDTVRKLVQLTNLKAVCTYNYDDLVETSAASGSFVGIVGRREALGQGVPVYHVHGLLPSDHAISPLGELVFSEDEYHAMYMNFGHWSNLIQLSLLLESDCVLFIGLSFEDPNLRRILDATLNTRRDLQLFNICKLPFSRPNKGRGGTSPMSPEQIHLSVMNAVYHDIGINNVWIDDFEPYIPIFLSAIGADDPIETYTSTSRTFLANRLSTLNQVGKCRVFDCNEPAIEGFDLCMTHTMGDQSRFTDYAPMPKTLRDTCNVSGCERISAGLSGRCLEHMRQLRS